MLIFQLYELLSDYARAARKQLAPCQYRAVIFDLGGVYVKYKDQALINSISQIASSNDTTLGRMFQDYELGKISFQQLKKSVDLRVNGQTPDRELETNPVLAANSAQFAASGKDENIGRAIERLRFYGLKTALLTNIGYTDDSMTTTVAGVPAQQLSDFDAVVESCRVQMRKPNPRIYESVARRMQLRPAECIYVDELARNCRGAEVAGMKSIQVIGGDMKRTVDQLSKLLGLDLF
ncbi:Acyl-CoA dehydrogenase family member 10 [Aphelenchoides fujianensis]|nr:Acyl-CoA dehydrogenase family member 10 [Aphelenchoides fujianensis]